MMLAVSKIETRQGMEGMFSGLLILIGILVIAVSFGSVAVVFIARACMKDRPPIIPILAILALCWRTLYAIGDLFSKD